MNKQLEIEYHMDTGMDPWRYDLPEIIEAGDDVPSDEYIQWLEEKLLSYKNGTK